MNKFRGGSPLRDKYGRWRKGVSGQRSGRAKTLKDTTLDAEVLAATNIRRIGQTLAQRAHAGDPHALQEVLQIIQRHQAPTGKNLADYTLLSNEELLVLEALSGKARGKNAPDLLAHVRALLQSLEPAVLEAEPVEEPVEEPTVEAETVEQIEQPSASPGPEAPSPPPARPESLTSGLVNRRNSWFRVGGEPDWPN